jgi:hypothetical protein
VQIATPLGTQRASYHFTQQGEILHGTARQGEETTTVSELALDDLRLTWLQQTTRPMKLKLRFEVVIDGDTMTGTARAAPLPASKVTGTRVPA